jgi:hypothetical protein
VTGFIAHKEDFRHRFARVARRVRWRLTARYMLTGAAFGLVAGTAVAAALYAFRQGELRPWAAGLGVVGALGGLLLSQRRRWSDADVALFVDARLGSAEAISTAVDLHSGANASSEPVRAVVLRCASSALAGAERKRVSVRMLSWWQLLAPAGALALVWLSVAALPPAPPVPAVEPGAGLVRIANLEGLAKIIALEQLDARDAEQRKRLRRIAQEARRLRRDLAQGIPKREAQARIARLRDDIAAERLSFADQSNRRGREAAVRKLEHNPHTRSAARALGNGDLTRFDEQMQSLANQAEKQDRAAAKRALEQAAQAARQRGARQLARALEEQQRLFDERAAGAEALRELAKKLQGKLSEQALRDLEEFGETGSPEAQQRLAEALEEALEQLTDEERKRLAEQLEQQIDDQGGKMDPLTREQIEKLAGALQSEAGKKQLVESLRKLAKPEPSPEARRRHGLGEADRGGAQCQRGLGVVPVPLPGQAASPGGPRGSKGHEPGADQGQRARAGSGGSSDAAAGKHGQKTDAVAGPELRAKARARLDPRAPMHGTSLGRAPARAGETANQVGTGALGRAAPQELSGVERSEVPEEYREQVGRYFEP